MKKLFIAIAVLGLLYFFLTPRPTFYQEGAGFEREQKKSHKVMTLNACMLDKGLHIKYGGMISPEERIERFANLIREQNPDVYLGQELTAISGQMLFEELQNEYPHFWIGMGSTPGASGLFVASKYPIVSEPQFINFPASMQIKGKVMDRGFFCLETPDFWIVTSHMEGGSVEKVAHLRKAQLAYITKQVDILAKGKPYILAGDLNIIRLNEPSDEYSQSGIQDLYYDFYTEQHPEFNLDTITNTNLFTAQALGLPAPTLLSDQHEIDDYFLVRKPHQLPNLNVSLLRVFDINKPNTEAITDHHSYIATFETP